MSNNFNMRKSLTNTTKNNYNKLIRFLTNNNTKTELTNCNNRTYPSLAASQLEFTAKPLAIYTPKRP